MCPDQAFCWLCVHAGTAGMAGLAAQVVLMPLTATITVAGIPDAGQPDASSPEGHGSKAEPQPRHSCPGLQSTPASSRENTSSAADGPPNVKLSPFVTAATPQRKSSSNYNILHASQQSSIRKKRAPDSACAAGAHQRSLNTGRRGKLHLQPPEASCSEMLPSRCLPDAPAGPDRPS